MSVKQCVVHIGLNKAASTTIQDSIEANLPSLRRAGVLYHTDIRVPETMRPADTDDVQGWVDALFSIMPVYLACNDVEKLVFSSEIIHFQPKQLIEEVIGFFRGHGLAVRLIVVVRDQATWLNSYYAHQATSLQVREAIGPFVERYLQAPAQDLQYDLNYLNRFGYLIGRDDVEVAFVPLHDRRDRRSIVHRFAEAAGIDDVLPAESGAHPGRARSAPGPNTVEALRRLARRLDLHPSDPRCRQAGHRLLVRARQLGWNAERFNGLTPERVARIDSHYAEANGRFAQAAWGAGWDEIYRRAPAEAFASNAVAVPQDRVAQGEIEPVVKSVEQIILGEQRPQAAVPG